MAIKRVLTGMRTTGELHLGHYVGALKLWLEAQSDPDQECFFLLADYQAATTHRDRPELIQQSIRDVTLDWLSVGLDPNLPNVHFVQQSQVLARPHLTLYLALFAKEADIKRNPTIKEEMEHLENVSMAFLLYPVDQVGDIEMISPPAEKGNQILVPVGRDQVPHLEYSRKLARAFNDQYHRPVFCQCEAQVGSISKLVGTDGSGKMSKSRGNAIYLSDSRAEVEKKVKRMYTDPKRIHATDPGTIEGNPLFMYFDAFAKDPEEVEEYKKLYQVGQIGDVPLKKRLAEIINEMLDPIREARFEAEEHVAVGQVIRAGTARANELANEVLERTQEAMHLTFPNP